MAKNTENKQAGLKIDKKTIVIICILLAAVMAFAGILTQVLPTGEYQTMINSDGKEAIIPGTYTEIDEKLPIWKIILAPILVFGTETALTGGLIIVLITLVGGTFLILDKCNVLKYIMVTITQKFKNKKYLLLNLMILACMLLSSTAGILEESVTLVPIAVAISLALGWDSFVGLGMSLIAIGFGYTAATFNPFNVLTVQKLAELEPFSGTGFRIIVFIAVYLVLAGFMTAYAKRIEKNPKKSICYESDIALRERYSLDDGVAILNDAKVRKATFAFLICLASVILCIIADYVFGLSGALSMGGMGILFFTGGVLAGILSGVKGKQLLRTFGEGIKTVAPIVPIIVIILAITYILDEGNIIHTILNFVYNLINGVSPYAAILLLFAFIVFLEFFVGSSTAKAFLIMPIILPLAEMVGVTDQSVVLTFCLSDGFTNLLYPTSGIMIIAIGLVNISYGKWLKFSWKLFALEGILSIALMLIAVAVNYS
ncbi:MAG: YfcC family protein [Clostridia bacterium]|nr:YfcC family protein [Clostridia bacterium]